jgi:hypothetical protein
MVSFPHNVSTPDHVMPSQVLEDAMSHHPSAADDLEAWEFALGGYGFDGGGWLATGDSYYSWRSRDLLRLVGDRVLVLRRALRGREGGCTAVDAKELGTLCCVTAGAMGLLAVGLSARHWPCAMLAFVRRSEGVMCQLVGESNMSSVR